MPIYRVYDLQEERYVGHNNRDNQQATDPYFEEEGGPTYDDRPTAELAESAVEFVLNAVQTQEDPDVDEEGIRQYRYWGFNVPGTEGMRLIR